MTCRCGHGRSWHFATANAYRKRQRRRWPTAAARKGCRWLAGANGHKVCPCRDFKPQEVNR